MKSPTWRLRILNGHYNYFHVASCFVDPFIVHDGHACHVTLTVQLTSSITQKAKQTHQDKKLGFQSLAIIVQNHIYLIKFNQLTYIYHGMVVTACKVEISKRRTCKSLVDIFIYTVPREKEQYPEIRWSQRTDYSCRLGIDAV